MKNVDDPTLNLNVRLIRKIQRAIVKWPKNYNQGNFGERGSLFGSFMFDAQKKTAPNCNSACCIAGWTLALSGYIPGKLRSGSIRKRAQKLLGLTSTQAWELFKGRDATPNRAVQALDRLVETSGHRSW